jgi:hypothetical protein
MYLWAAVYGIINHIQPLSAEVLSLDKAQEASPRYPRCLISPLISTGCLKAVEKPK